MPSDPGSFFVHRIEGVGYNDPGAAAAMRPADLEGPKRGGLRRYTKLTKSGGRPASMHLAVFYNRGEAFHIGSNDLASHGCIHIDSANWDTMTQLNYHSVVGRTKVEVTYSGAAGKVFAP